MHLSLHTVWCGELRCFCSPGEQGPARLAGTGTGGHQALEQTPDPSRLGHMYSRRLCTSSSCFLAQTPVFPLGTGGTSLPLYKGILLPLPAFIFLGLT